MAYINIKSWERAEGDCTEAIRIDSKYVKAYARRATARKNLGNINGAVQDYQSSLSLEPGNKQVIDELAKLEKLKTTLPIKDNSNLTTEITSTTTPTKKKITIIEVDSNNTNYESTYLV